jgi:hypothetical protein
MVCGDGIPFLLGSSATGFLLLFVLMDNTSSSTSTSCTTRCFQGSFASSSSSSSSSSRRSFFDCQNGPFADQLLQHTRIFFLSLGNPDTDSVLAICLNKIVIVAVTATVAVTAGRQHVVISFRSDLSSRTLQSLQGCTFQDFAQSLFLVVFDS